MTEHLKNTNYNNQLITEFGYGTIYNKKATGQVGKRVNLKMHPGTVIPGLNELLNTPVRSPEGVIVRQTPTKQQRDPFATPSFNPRRTTRVSDPIFTTTTTTTKIQPLSSLTPKKLKFDK
jgi:hypothetical protein